MTAIVTFAATNVDDIFILLMFFSQANASFRKRHIVIGQYLGFVALVAISLLGFWGSFMIPQEFIGLLGILPIAIGIRRWVEPANAPKSHPTSIGAKDTPSMPGAVLNPRTYSVAAVTFANGGDNIGIYTSLFASLDLLTLLITLVVFFLLVLVWCVIGIRLTHQQHVAHYLSRYGDRVVPVVLIGLGVFIIIENGTLHLFGL